MQFFVLLCLLIVASVFDIKSKKVPNRFQLAMLGIGLVFCIINHVSPLWMVLRFVIIIAVGMVLWKIGAFGAADVKLVANGSLFLLGDIWKVLFVSMLIFSMVGVIKKLKERSVFSRIEAMPFVPCFCVSVIVVKGIL